ncbi:hypothetical protein B0I73DRAFT_131781 [Yarrowia lipolytica]|uniref:YALI0F23133p n=2 Tax=Yarrowia lipolytica TaxID=4952 RepID=Q6C0N6_YARLI|nr:YALI0F23133p [Yarrowia lipolytica CLIB122]AOW07594.1 hypothetical protein YALI1_F30367g [Yarrowia lipolytica]KAB8280485.1 hypothetical protein BKA91DRAFT_141854 [Yarrowia lipolytica]KAE8169596.1 hypothetical protein BKA90DRAFT_142346 [Yarrowia lipolytica]KAJ8055340.1 hypothetical protein LXG23DRAFT_18868 [Yarrowia lipolytica]RDW39588.1 hypothetical protein B0I73DRAFT_131781 [Yarrowia lipolytica]|eukprot:XP_505776.1 YALI0F23133p [Yarrowia lipolytica CLIB122]
MQQPPANSALALKIRNATSADDYMALGLSSWQSTMSKYSIADVVIIEQQLRSKKDRRNEELRCLINTTYRDLLGTTDDIQSLSEKMTKQHTLLSNLSHGDIKQELAVCDKSLERWVKETKANEAQLDKSAIESILRKLLFFADSRIEQSNLLMARLFYLHSLDGSNKPRDFLKSKYRKLLINCLSGEISPSDLLSYCIFFSVSVEDAFEDLLKLRFEGLEQKSLTKALTSISYTLKFASKYLASASLKSSILYQLESAQFSSEGTLCETLKTELRKQNIALLLNWDTLPRQVAEAASIPSRSKYSRDDKFPKRIIDLLQEYCRDQMGPVLDRASTDSIKSRDTLEGLIDLLRDVFGLFRKSRDLRNADFGSVFNIDKFLQAWKTKFHELIKANLGEVDFGLFKNKIKDKVSLEAIISFDSPLVNALTLVGAGKSSKIDVMGILDTRNKVTGSSAFTIVSQYEQVLQNVAKIRAVLGSLKEVFVKVKGSLDDDDEGDDEDDEWTSKHVALLEKEYTTSEEFITTCLAGLHSKILTELEKCSHKTIDECKFVLQIALSMHEAGTFDKIIGDMYSELAELIGTEFVSEMGENTSNTQLVLFQSREKLTRVFSGPSSLFTVCPRFESVFMPKYSAKVDVQPEEKTQSDLLFA